MKKRLLYTILSISLLTVMAGAAIAPALGPGAAAAHMGTFPVAYTFTPVLEWLFGQVKRVPTANIITP